MSQQVLETQPQVCGIVTNLAGSWVCVVGFHDDPEAHYYVRLDA